MKAVQKPICEICQLPRCRSMREGMRSGGVGRKLEPATRLLGTLALGFAAMVSIGSLAGHAENIARGPLRVLPGNPRYFTDGSGKAIYLTASHTWSNLARHWPDRSSSCL